MAGRPSDFPDFAQFLVVLGIDPSSVPPDQLLKTKRTIVEVSEGGGIAPPLMK
jgi:hypothetical protein